MCFDLYLNYIEVFFKKNEYFKKPNKYQSFKVSPLVKGGELIVSQDLKRTYEELGHNPNTHKIQENLGLLRYDKNYKK